MKLLLTISRILTGLVFTFSGFVKAVDPVGTQIKFGDYFEAMGLDFLIPATLIFSIILNAAELVVGIALLINLLPKISSWGALAFMVLFTPLTLWLAVANPVTDCGCFGDAIKLTNWETFGKNVILLILALTLFLNREKLTSRYSIKKSRIQLIIIIIAVLSFQFTNLTSLPLIDFRPFKKGVNIREATLIPKDAKKDIYETALFYKNLKTGEKKKFNMDNIPYEDTLTWEYDTTITELISKGYEPPIHDFFLTDLNGNDRTELILSNIKTSYILILHNFAEGVKKIDISIEEIAQYAKDNKINFFCFTSSGNKEIIKYKDFLPANIIVCTGDYKMLKTFARTNPSFVILKNAVIKEKVAFKKAKKIYKNKTK